MAEPVAVRLSSTYEAFQGRVQDRLKVQQKTPPDYDTEFDYIWERYPLKVAVKAAKKAYIARRRAGIDPHTLLEAVTLYAEQRKGEDPKYTLRGSTFFGPDERWKEPFERKMHGRADGKWEPPMEDLSKRFGEDEEANDDDPLKDI